jgi:hypothetical protein
VVRPDCLKPRLVKGVREDEQEREDALGSHASTLDVRYAEYFVDSVVGLPNAEPRFGGVSSHN